MVQNLGAQLPNLKNVQDIGQQVFQDNVDAGKELAQQLSSLSTLVTAQSNIFDIESQAIGKNQVKLNDKKSEYLSLNEGKPLTGPQTDALIEMILGMITADTLDKKRKKDKSAFDELLEDLAGLEGLIDKSHLNEAEKEELEKLFQNLDRMKQLKQRLRNVEEQEKKLEKQLKEQHPHLQPNIETLEPMPEFEEPKLNLPKRGAL